MPKQLKSRGKRSELRRWLEQSAATHVGDAEWMALQRELAPISTSYLRRLLREVTAETNVTLSPTVEGVRQDTLDSLERSLGGLLVEYEAADREGRKLIRRLVIEAKDHARLAGRKPEIRELKAEMQMWMLTWLENPGLFLQWVELRKRQLGHTDHVRQEAEEV